MNENHCGLVMPPNSLSQWRSSIYVNCFRLLDLFGRRFYSDPKIFKKSVMHGARNVWSGYEKVMEVPLSGCFMFIRTDILKRIGGFF